MDFTPRAMAPLVVLAVLIGVFAGARILTDNSPSAFNSSNCTGEFIASMNSLGWSTIAERFNGFETRFTEDLP